MLQSLCKAYPSAKVLRCLEDNDPTGYKSTLGMNAKKEAIIFAIDFPPHSPDLNPLGYAVRSRVNQLMREQEKAFPKSKPESRDQFLARLRRTAMSLPSDCIDRALAHQKKRCAACVKAKGGHFPEGGLK